MKTLIPFWKNPFLFRQPALASSTLVENAFQLRIDSSAVAKTRWRDQHRLLQISLMKTRFLFASAILFIVISSRGQISAQTPAAPQDTSYAVTARGPHTSVWERTTCSQLASGQWVTNVQSYVETSTGLNFFDSNTGQWQPSSAQIAPSGSGFAALNCQHKVTFAADLATTTEGTALKTPNGQQLNMHLIGLSYADRASGKSVWIALVTNSTAQVSSNEVWYPSAFSGVSGSVTYVNTLQGLEQNVVLNAQPAPPEAYGLSSQTTVLQAITEFISPPVPVITTNATSGDETLDFSAMRFGRGSAFLTGNNSGGVAVQKQWITQNGRWFLVEQVPIAQIASQLDALPAGQTASIKRRRNSILNVVSKKRLWPVGFAKNDRKGVKMLSQRNVQQKNGVTMATRKRAGSETGAPSFVLDFVTLNTSQTNMVFQGDTTYYVSGGVGLYGTNTTFEGGTVIKYTNNVILAIESPVSWLSSAYRPIIMTAKDDNSVGDAISGSTGSPTNYYALKALLLNGSASLQYFRIAYATYAFFGSPTLNLTNGQIINCENGVSASQVNMENLLFANVQNSCVDGTGTNSAQNTTFAFSEYLNTSPDAEFFLTNCIFADVTNAGRIHFNQWAQGQNNGFYNSFGGGTTGGNPVTTTVFPFQSVGAGSYYLADGCAFRDAGTTNIDPALLAELQQKTTYPPIVYSNTTISATEFSPQAQRETTNTPDLGYHYDSLDWVFGGVTANGNLTFDPGTAVGWFQTASGNGYGIQLSNDVTNTFNGTVTLPCVFARYDTVQEGGNGNWTSQGSLAGISTVGISTNFSEIDAKFAHCYALAGDPNHFRDYLARLDVHANHSEFHSGHMAGYWLGQFMTNCLYDRLTQYGSQQKSDGLFWRNCTMHGGQVFVVHSQGCCWPVWIENCAFDGTTTHMDDNSGGNTNITYCDFNGFLNGAQRLAVLGAHDQVISNFTWLTGTFGSFYEPDGSQLSQVGSVTADLIGLYHFTTSIDANSYQGNSTVDIGYHYVAVDSNGNPLDRNNDGIPDYLEDANGNGSVDSGEIGWNINGDLGLKVQITRPQNNSIIP